jgi:N-methylhydantoinase A
MSWRIAIDVGGTFTDVVALNEESGDEAVVKTPSTPGDPSQAFIAGVDEMLTRLSLEAADVEMLFHGTTVATNAILEAKYSRMGLIVNRGFREMLECARQTVPGDFGDITWWIKPPRVVPLELVREIEGRLDFHGEELRPLDEDEIRRCAAEFRELGVDALAVSLLHSYRSPAHEERVREVIKEEHPECFVSISSDVIREYREYERTLSTCLNTGLMPLLSSYIGRLEDRMSGTGMAASLQIMKSSGGVANASELIQRPIAAVLSGPAAGVVGCCAVAAAAGFDRVLTFDMGGTSTDIALIDGGVPRLLTEGKIDIYDIKVPMIDMTAVGAGGGSIAWLGGGKSLRVGPQSAGADPGPVCYGAGGEEPTVTDANVVLGRISPYLLGGDVKLDRDLAEEAIRSKIAEPLELTIHKAARGILEIAIQNMAAGVRIVSVKRGRDPRDYSLMAFGGAGGLHACLAAEALGIKSILVPLSPGATAAEGLLYSDVRVDHVITDVQREDELDTARLSDELRHVRDRALGDLAAQGFGAEKTRLEVFFDMRYAGQAYELRIPISVDDGQVDEALVRRAVADFHHGHEDQYGYSYEGKELSEVVNIGVTGFGLLSRPELRRDQGSGKVWDDALKYTREMYVSESEGMREVPVYERSLAPREVTVDGPAIIEQYDSTTVVDAGWSAALNEYGHIVLRRV